jgi:signal-transduction protein with cAMP-binding, CBS, and nucleotidyltransferase domain
LIAVANFQNNRRGFRLIFCLSLEHRTDNTQIAQAQTMDIRMTLPIFEGNPLFAVLAPEEILMLQQTAAVHTYSKHQVIYKPGQAANKVYFLLKGTVKIAVHAEKKDIIKYVVRATNLFGESCLTGEIQRRDFAYAMDDSVQKWWKWTSQALPEHYAETQLRVCTVAAYTSSANASATRKPSWKKWY